MKIRSILKKTLAVVLTLAMLAPIMSNLEVNVKEVQAEETSTNDSLNVKCQVTQGVVATTSIDKYYGKYVMRFVSAIEDYQDYREIGFKLIEEGETKEKKAVVKTVFKRIESTTGSTADGTKETYNYSPKVIDTTGEYFMTAKLPIEPEKVATKYTVWAYGIKKDGSQITGPQRCVSVNDGLEGCTTINMSFDNISATSVAVGDALTANGLPAEVIGVSNDGKRVHVRITPGETVLKSATLFEFKQGDTKIGEAIFRNLNTKYTGTADTSWYDVYSQKGYDEFVIATSADLYGLADVVNSNSTVKVYLVSDIEANKGYADKTNLTWDSSLAADGTTAITGTSYPWTAIGSATTRFNGVFDGQMHTISGIYLDATTSNQGMFSVTGSDAKVRNFYLKNSYFKATGSSKITGLGSIVGSARGSEFEKIYSDAIVAGYSKSNDVGGMIGITEETSVSISDCWFAGSATINGAASYLGGLIAYANIASVIKNCLNTGEVYHKYSVNTAGTGGFVGNAYANVEIINGVNHSNVKYTKGNGVGLFVGMYTGTVTISNSHTIDYDKKLVGSSDTYDGCTRSDAANVAGLKSLTTDNVKELFLSDTAKGHWSITKDTLPVLSAFEQGSGVTAQAVDTSWYDDSKSEFTLMDSGDLYGLALLSQTETFDNTLIKLGADIEVNKGKASTAGWDSSQDVNGNAITNGTDFSWMPIGTVSGKVVFNGEFDGQMHTISGIYLDATSSYQGLFSGTGANAEIRNFYLKNSYFKATTSDKIGQLGSVVGNAVGTFERIYSDAIVAGYCYRVGGLFGATGGKVTMDDCWFAGSATINAAASYLGGLIGNAAYQCTITNCLTTGEVYHKGSVGTAAAGGFVGTADAAVTILNGVNHSNVKYTAGSYIGLFVGRPQSTVTLTNSHSISYSGKNLVNTSNDYSGCTRQNASSVAGLNALTTANVKELFFSDTAAGHWSITKDTMPVLSAFEEGSSVISQAVDTSWYDESKSEFTLMDSGDLYGFALLSQTNTFAGKTIKLGADIEVNKGKATETGWDTTMSANGSAISNGTDFLWMPIGKTTFDNKDIEVYFEGTFDGQMHTISGIYLTTSKLYQGLFVATGSNAEVKNFYLRNSYFYQERNSSYYVTGQLGSIAGNAKGTFDTIYSDAIVRSCNNYAGGLIGSTTSTTSYKVTLKNCWFDGLVECAQASSYYGGLIGHVRTTVDIISCMNTADVKNALASSTSGTGGFVGHVNKGTLNIYNSLNTGNATYKSGAKYFGLFVGQNAGTVNADSSHSVKKAGKYLEGNDSGGSDPESYVDCSRQESADIAGTNAYMSMPSLFAGYGQDYWVCSEDGVPVLASFAKKLGITTIQAVDASATSQEVATLTTLYGGRKLYQGELHDHADTSVGSNDGTSDGATELDKWFPQMVDKGLDFAASLDHQQTTHIDSEYWDVSKLVYGTEASATVRDNENKYHFNMLFKNQEDLVDILKNSQFGFSYGLYWGNVNWEANDNNGQREFYYPTLSASTFTTLITEVQKNKGFFVLPHPLNYPDNTGGIDTYAYADGIGLEVMYAPNGTDEGQKMYNGWMELLKDGHKIYACAGSDSHKDLNNQALTSIYAKVLDNHTACTTDDAKKVCSSTECNKGNMIETLAEGNFVAGSVGIKMSVGNTLMGGTCDFTDQKLVVDVDKIHASAYDASHKYRLDVMDEEGIVCFKYLTFTKDAETGDMLGDDLVINTDAERKLYRVVITDVTIGKRIAIGNPIWNSNQ